MPMTILRDTGASESFILQDVLPFSSLSDTGTSPFVCPLVCPLVCPFTQKNAVISICELSGGVWGASLFASGGCGYNNGK